MREKKKMFCVRKKKEIRLEKKIEKRKRERDICCNEQYMKWSFRLFGRESVCGCIYVYNFFIYVNL